MIRIRKYSWFPKWIKIPLIVYERNHFITYSSYKSIQCLVWNGREIQQFGVFDSKQIRISKIKSITLLKPVKKIPWKINYKSTKSSDFDILKVSQLNQKKIVILNFGNYEWKRTGLGPEKRRNWQSQTDHRRQCKRLIDKYIFFEVIRMNDDKINLYIYLLRILNRNN